MTSVEERERLAEERRLLIHTVDDQWVEPADLYTCHCGEVFSSAQAYADYCPSECPMAERRDLAAMKAASRETLHTVYCMFRFDGIVLKVDLSLEGAQGEWWWRNVAAITTHHYGAPEAALEALENLRLKLKPVYDVDPFARDRPRPLSQRVPAPIDGPKSIPITLRVSDELEARIVAAAAEAGVPKAEWLRRAAELLS